MFTAIASYFGSLSFNAKVCTITGALVLSGGTGYFLGNRFTCRKAKKQALIRAAISKAFVDNEVNTLTAIKTVSKSLSLRFIEAREALQSGVDQTRAMNAETAYQQLCSVRAMLEDAAVAFDDIVEACGESLETGAVAADKLDQQVTSVKVDKVYNAVRTAATNAVSTNGDSEPLEVELNIA